MSESLIRVWVVVDNRHKPDLLVNNFAYSDPYEAQRVAIKLRDAHGLAHNTNPAYSIMAKELILR